MIKKQKSPLSVFLQGLIVTLIVMCTALVVSLVIRSFSRELTYISFLFVFAVVVISRLTEGYVWGLIASIMGVFGVNFFFTYPIFQFDFDQPGYMVTFTAMFLVSVVSSVLVTNIKEQADCAKNREARINGLYEVSQKLLNANGRENIISVAVNSLSEFAQKNIVFFGDVVEQELTEDSVDKDSSSPLIKEFYCSNEEKKDIFLSKIELATVSWVLRHRVEAGCNKDYFSDSNAIYVPVLAHESCYGVLGVDCFETPPDDELEAYMEMITFQIAVALERQELSDKKAELAVNTEREKMRSNLLRAVSHDLRTPLTSISGSCTTILENQEEISLPQQRKLLEGVDRDAKWLIRMVENLLSVTKISDGTTKLLKVPEVMEEVIGEALARVKRTYKLCKITPKVPCEYVEIPMDATLIEQTIINLIENSIKHSGVKEEDLQVDLEVTYDEKNAYVAISDNGLGIPKEKLPFNFEEYHAGSLGDGIARNMGIGLTICASIIKAHGGVISADNNEKGGATVAFSLGLEV